MGHSRRPLAQIMLVGALVAGLAVAAAGCGGTASTIHKAALASASTDPYIASSRYAVCMRQHGVPHPNPDKRGDFRLTPSEERRMRAVPRSKREAAGKACFHHLKGLNMSPLSRQAKERAFGVLRQLSRCMKGYGYSMGPPLVKNMSRGRAFFGFRTPHLPPMTRRLRQTQHTCEKRVDLAGKLDRIVADDRSGL
jgi:hypothetical protein